MTVQILTPRQACTIYHSHNILAKGRARKTRQKKKKKVPYLLRLIDRGVAAHSLHLLKLLHLSGSLDVFEVHVGLLKKGGHETWKAYVGREGDGLALT